METFSLGLRYKKDGQTVERDLILRRQPVAGLLDPYDVSIEYRVITALAKAGVALPETYWHEPDPGGVLRPFYAMEKVHGEVHFWKMSLDPNFKLIPDDRERERLRRTLSPTSRRSIRRTGGPWVLIFSVIRAREGSAQSQVDHWEEVIARAGFLHKPVVNYAAHWLRDNLPDCDRVVVVHGDYRTGNYIHQNGRIKAVLDWEMVHLGDPMDDISYIIGTAWRSPRPRSWISHLMPQDEFYERYRDATGIRIDPERLRWYHILINFKSVGIGTTAVNAFRSRPDTDMKTGVFGCTVPIMYFNLIRAMNKYVEKA